MRRISKGLKEGQMSPSQQAIAAPSGRHCLRITHTLKKGERQSFPFQQRVGVREQCPLFPAMSAEEQVLGLVALPP